MSSHIAMGPGPEFDLIRAMLARWGERARGIGDDVAILDLPPGERLVVSTDTSVEKVHFKREWLTPSETGYRAVTAALSDLAASGASPIGVLVAITLPPALLPHALEIADGIGTAVFEAETYVLGGDLSSGSELSFTVTVLGHAAERLRRGKVLAGDVLYLTGRLGGPAAALRAWSEAREPSAEARQRFAHPNARIREARWLADRGAHAAIDISDGLLADAAHLAIAGNVRLILELESVRTVGGLTPLEASASGEEYELLVAAPARLDVRAFEKEFALPLTPIGRVETGLAEVRAMYKGERVAASGGFSHFS